jgi:predicted 3-demethylubiquinone-9 3-methyltransferase (glyoxalase superfamily)
MQIGGNAMPKIAPCLWFDRNEAEEAAKFYTSIFPDSHVDKVVKSAAENPSTPAGAVLTVEFTLSGQHFIGLNGGPDFKFNEAISFSIDCKDQAEVDRYWDALVQGGGEHSVCGWLKDRFGVSWQVVPRQLNEMLESPDRAAAARAMEAMLKMQKIDIEQLREAYEGVPA